MGTIAGSVILNHDPAQRMTFEYESNTTVERKKITMRRYNDEERDFLKVIVPGHRYAEIAALFNAQFESVITVSQIKSFISNNKLNTGYTGLFPKGHIPFNKGKKGVGGWKPTQFKKGHMPVNHRPVGSERVDADGYTMVKVAEPNKWRMKHVVTWEATNGPIPRGHVVIFGDGDKSNFGTDNLLLISRAELAVINKHRLVSNDTELTKLGITIANIYMKIGERRKK